MQLTFESLTELKDFMGWIGDLTRPVIDAVPKATIVVKDLPVGDGDAVDDPAPVEQDAPTEAADKPVRKRRTKVEMEAARAVESANPPPVVEMQTESAPAVAVGDAPPVQTVAVDKGDSAEFIKSRLAERPEVSQVEHLNLARTFIGKHGMEKYNASFPLAGLTPNVMGYSPADCATHAAALDFLSLE